jgi:hypothetical protein
LLVLARSPPTSFSSSPSISPRTRRTARHRAPARPFVACLRHLFPTLTLLPTQLTWRRLPALGRPMALRHVLGKHRLPKLLAHDDTTQLEFQYDSWPSYCFSVSGWLLLAPFNHCIRDILARNDVISNGGCGGHWVGKTRRCMCKNTRDNRGSAMIGVWMIG